MLFSYLASHRVRGTVHSRPTQDKRFASNPTLAARPSTRRKGIGKPLDSHVTAHVSLNPESVTSKVRDGLYCDQYQVRSYEVNPARQASLATITRLLNETASNHALNVGFVSDDGYCVDENMAKNNLIWVLSKMRLKIIQSPTWGQSLDVNTWFQFYSKVAARRDWNILDTDTGEEIVAATSLWVLVNTETRRLARLPPTMIEQYRSHCPDPPQWALGDGECCNKIPDVQNVEVGVAGLKARLGDIDMNKHINNAVYVDWIMETIPKDLWFRSELTEIDLEWCAEADPEVLIDSHTSLDPDFEDESHSTYVHRLVQEQGKVCFRARSTWRHKINHV